MSVKAAQVVMITKPPMATHKVKRAEKTEGMLVSV
jgi:hypothetical protein